MRKCEAKERTGFDSSRHAETGRNFPSIDQDRLRTGAEIHPGVELCACWRVLCKQAPPLTVTAAVKKIVWDDVWTLPKNASALVQESRGDAVAATTSVELVPYGCSKVYKISMFPYV